MRRAVTVSCLVVALLRGCGPSEMIDMDATPCECGVLGKIALEVAFNADNGRRVARTLDCPARCPCICEMGRTGFACLDLRQRCRSGSRCTAPRYPFLCRSR
jgi:hypothetical protein